MLKVNQYTLMTNLGDNDIDRKVKNLVFDQLCLRALHIGYIFIEYLSIHAIDMQSMFPLPL